MTPAPPDLPTVEGAVEVLRRGGLVAFPTETVYGLGADASNEAAVARIFAVKGRPPHHPLIVHLPSAEALEAWARGDLAAAHRLAERFWPGPLTLVLRRQPWVSHRVTGGAETVALRVPAHPLALELLRRFGGGIAAPSANRFGSVSPTTAQHVRQSLGDAVDLILDGGPCPVGVESTILDLSGSTPAVLRPGGVPREELEAVLGHALLVPARPNVPSPGQHPRHYSPTATLLLVERESLPWEAIRLSRAGRRVGVLLPPGSPPLPGEVHAAVRLPADLAEYARQLYALLIHLDELGCQVILATLPPEEGLGAAIADRLRRAAAGEAPL